MDRPSVLVVEDRPSVLKLMATILDGAYLVTTAADGATALERIGSAPVDVVLTDIRMPGASGFEVLRAVQERSPRTRVVMMTAYANIPDAVAAMRNGAYDYVAKPLDADEIKLVVARAAALARGTAPADGADPVDGHRSAAELVGEGSVGFHRAIEEARDRASRAYLLEVLRLSGGNVTRAACRAGMTRESLHRVMRKYGIRAADGRRDAAPGSADGAGSDEEPSTSADQG